jgi:hypothetical protein
VNGDQRHRQRQWRNHNRDLDRGPDAMGKHLVGVGGAKLTWRWPAPVRGGSQPTGHQAVQDRETALALGPQGKSPREALRCLKGRLSDAVCRCLLTNQRGRLEAATG